MFKGAAYVRLPKDAPRLNPEYTTNYHDMGAKGAGATGGASKGGGSQVDACENFFEPRAAGVESCWCDGATLGDQQAHSSHPRPAEECPQLDGETAGVLVTMPPPCVMAITRQMRVGGWQCLGLCVRHHSGGP